MGKKTGNLGSRRWNRGPVSQRKVFYSPVCDHRDRLDSNTEYFFHLTTLENWSKINRSGFIQGREESVGTYGDQETGRPLYVLDSDDWDVWNSVGGYIKMSSPQWRFHRLKIRDSGMGFLDDHSDERIQLDSEHLSGVFVVLGFPKSLVTNCEVKEDISTELFNHHYRRVYLGDQTIPLDSVIHVGTYRDDFTRYKKFRDEYVHKTMGLDPTLLKWTYSRSLRTE